jgi:hypothetical protein
MKKNQQNSLITLIEKLKIKRQASMESRLVQNEDKFIEI